MPAYPTRPSYPTSRTDSAKMQRGKKTVAATVRSIFPRPRRGLVFRLACAAAASFVAVQAITVAALIAVDTQRKRRHSSPEPFPHSELPPVAHGENDLEVYTYGEDVYSAMLASIDAAETSIFLETYIWKNDELGRRFKEHLVRKAEEGVQVY